MPWVRFDDRFPTHRKIRRLSDAAFRMHVSAIHWCSEHLTDGHVPAGELDLVSDVKSPLRVVPELERAGLWKPSSSGWEIHDFLEYQPSAEKVRAERDAKKERQERWKEKQRAASRKAAGDASQDTSGDGSKDDSPYPSRPVPVPSRPLGDELGGEGAVGERANEAPSPRCPTHSANPTTAPCGGCKEARLEREAWDRSAGDRRREAVLAARRCRHCDADGQRYQEGTRIPMTPYVRCDHRPLRSVG
jgi:hypothetical protein